MTTDKDDEEEMKLLKLMIFRSTNLSIPALAAQIISVMPYFASYLNVCLLTKHFKISFLANIPNFIVEKDSEIKIGCYFSRGQNGASRKISILFCFSLLKFDEKVECRFFCRPPP